MVINYRAALVWLVLLAAAFAGGIALGVDHGAGAVQARWDAAELDRAKSTLKQVERVREAQKEIDERHETVVKELSHENSRLRADYRRLADSLRERPDSVDAGHLPDAPPAAPAGTWCTGAQLYGDHAEAFAREAARAEYLQSALRACYALE